MEKKEKAKINKIAKQLKDTGIADEKKAVKNNPTSKGGISTLKIHTVEPVVKPPDKRNKIKGEVKNGTKKSKGKNTAGPRRSNRKTDKGTITKSEEEADKGKKGGVAVQDRGGREDKRRKGVIGIPWW